MYIVMCFTFIVMIIYHIMSHYARTNQSPNFIYRSAPLKFPYYISRPAALFIQVVPYSAILSCTLTMISRGYHACHIVRMYYYMKLYKLYIVAVLSTCLIVGFVKSKSYGSVRR